TRESLERFRVFGCGEPEPRAGAVRCELDHRDGHVAEPPVPNFVSEQEVHLLSNELLQRQHPCPVRRLPLFPLVPALLSLLVVAHLPTRSPLASFGLRPDRDTPREGS